MTRHVMLDNVTYKDLRVIRDYARVPAYDVNVALTRQMRAQLPKNRELVNKICEYGLQSI